jgi:secondary thiamine-phosphate synthase enzyme
MKSLTEYLWFEIPDRRGFANITSAVEAIVRKGGFQEGLCLVNAMHITASGYINDQKSGLLHDYEVWLEKLAPHAPTTQYQHNRTGEENADAHLKRQIMVAKSSSRLPKANSISVSENRFLWRIRRAASETRARENR